jgi:hypothetical protein
MGGETQTTPMYLLKVNFTLETKLDDLNTKETAEHALNMACTYLEQNGISVSYRIQEFFDI